MPSDPLSAARALLPAWVIWSPLLGAAAASAVTALLAAASLAWTGREVRRLPSDAHWTDRARALARPRRILLVTYLTAVVIGGPLFVGGELSLPGRAAAFALHLMAPLLIVVAFAIGAENAWARPLALGTRLPSLAAWLVVLFPAQLIGVTAAVLLPWTRAGSAGVALGLGAVLAAAAGGSWPVARAIGLLCAAPPRVTSAMSRAAAALGVAPPPVWLAPIASGNAFAAWLRPAVVVTAGALEALDDEELAAVFGHELGHLAEPLGLRLASVAMAALLPAGLVLGAPVYRAWGEPGLLGLGVTVLVSLLVLLRLGRALEGRADLVGARAGAPYARALERLHALNLAPAVTGRKGSHPDLYDRMVAAGITPGWPRPAPPRSLWPVALVLVGLLATGVVALSHWRRVVAPCDGARTAAALHLGLALDGGACELAWLAMSAVEHDEPPEALILIEAAVWLEPGEPRYRTWQAYALLQAGRCQDAGAALRAAQERSSGAEALEGLEAAVAGCVPAP